MATATVTNTVHTTDGLPVTDLLVTAQLTPPNGQSFQGGTELFAIVERTTGDGAGSWSLTLERTDTMTPSGMTYMVTERSDADQINRVSYITMPAGGGTLSALLQAPPSPVPLTVISESAVTGLVGDLAAINAALAEIDTDLGGDLVNSVTAGDGTIVIGGTATAPTVRVGTGIAEASITNLTTDLAAAKARAIVFPLILGG